MFRDLCVRDGEANNEPLLIAGGAGIAIGVIPGLQLGGDLAPKLREGGRHSTGGAARIAGIVGVVAYAVGQRTHEIGIRMALGARRTHVLGMLLVQGLAPVVIGLVVGILTSLLAGRLLSGLPFEVRPSDPLTFAAVSVALLVTAAAAIDMPARRATTIDPMIAFKAEG